MAYEERSISNDISSDANFRTWGSTISDLWQDVGLTKTADTGQIDWATVVRPAINTFAGYEIFTLDTDTEQANFGLYIRVDYGVGGAQDRQRLKIQIGESTNGAGTLTGKTGTAQTFTAISSNSSSFTHYCSAGDGYFAYAGAWSAGTSATAYLANQIFIIERLRDNTGAPTDQGIYTFFSGVTASSRSDGYAQIVRSDDNNPPYLASSSVGNFRLGGFVPNLSGNRGNDLYLYTHQPADYAIYNPCLSNLFYYQTDLTAGDTFTVDMYGTSRTFKALGRNSTHSTTNFQRTAFGHDNSALAIRWE